MRGHLFDINVLLALAWPNHPNHAAAHRWFEGRRPRLWATCTVTQLGFVRISSNPKFSPLAVSPGQAHALLARWTEDASHRYWPEPDDGVFSEACIQIMPNILTHSHVMAGYLVAVAKTHGGRLATLDQPLRRMFPDEVELISPMI